MSNETAQKLKKSGYSFSILSYGIDVFDGSDQLMGDLKFHGHEIEIIYWLKTNGEW